MIREAGNITLARASAVTAGSYSRHRLLLPERAHPVAARLLTGDASLCQDVVQDAFVKVIQHLDRYDPEGSSALSTWIITLATRTALDCLRGTRREGNAIELVEEGAVAPGGDRDRERAAVTRELGGRVQRAIAAMPDDPHATPCSCYAPTVTSATTKSRRRYGHSSVLPASRPHLPLPERVAARP